jgi:hypothetical protein
MSEGGFVGSASSRNKDLSGALAREVLAIYLSNPLIHIQIAIPLTGREFNMRFNI